MSAREHWKRHTIDGGHVYSLVVQRNGERWTAKLIPSKTYEGVLPSIGRVWRETVLVHQGTRFTKRSLRAMLEALVECAAFERAERP